MPISSRYDDPILEQVARDTFALFPHCHRCGRKIEWFEDADIRILVQRVVHRGGCPEGGDGSEDAGMSEGQEHDSDRPTS